VIRLTDEQWERIRNHFPEEHIADGRPGRKPIPTRPMRLKRALVAAHRGERDLIGAISDYEAGVIDYGFRAVRNSLQAMHQTLDQGPSGFSFPVRCSACSIGCRQ
jgi:hypothetical protein